MATYEEKNGFQKFVETMKELTWKERIAHFWEYYKWVAIAVIAVIIAAVSVVISVQENSKPLLYGGVAVNVNVSEEASAYLVDGWMKHVQGDPKKDRVDFSEMLLNLEANTMSDLGMANAEKLLTMVESGDLDYLIMDAYALSYCGGNGIFAPLENALSAQTIAKFEGKLVTIETDDGSYYGAIDITDLPFVKANMTSNDKIYIAFPGNTGRESKNEAFLQYLMNWTA